VSREKVTGPDYQHMMTRRIIREEVSKFRVNCYVWWWSRLDLQDGSMSERV
jgi:hypothetical protein